MSTLYRKYRPQTWGAVAGQEHIKTILMYQVQTGSHAHAYLFSGSRGIGKTTTARIFAKAINCQAIRDARKKDGALPPADPCGSCLSCTTITEGKTMDLIELDAASHRGIDVVRQDIIENARFGPSQLTYKVFIIDEVHMLTTEAFNALLKTLEEPPAHAVFILATTELHKVPETIISRCQCFGFSKISLTVIVDRLRGMAKDEGFDVEEQVLLEIARHAEGGLRDAEGLLGKVLAIGEDKKVTYAQAAMVLPQTSALQVSEFVGHLMRRDASAALMTIHTCVEHGLDMAQFAQESIELVRKTALVATMGNSDLLLASMAEAERESMAEWSRLHTPLQLTRTLEILLEKQKMMAMTQPEHLPLELAVIQICENEQSSSGGASHAVSASSSAPAPTAAQPLSQKIIEKQSEPMAVTAVVAAQPESSVSAAEEAENTRTEEVSLSTVKSISEEVSDTPIISLERIRELWAEFLRKADEVNHSLPFLLSVAQPVAVEGRCVKVGFQHAFHREKLHQIKNKKMLETVLRELTQHHDIELEGVILEKTAEMMDNDAVPAPIASAVPAKAASSDTSLEAMFGGKVVG